MKINSLLAFASALALSVSFAAAGDDTPLAKEMAAMNRSLKALKKSAEDPAKKADNLALVDKIKGHLVESNKLEPAKTKEQPAAEKTAYLEKYKKQMDELIATIDELKAAIDKGDNEAIKKCFTKLGEQKEKGHKDFAPDE